MLDTKLKEDTDNRYDFYETYIFFCYFSIVARKIQKKKEKRE